MAVNDIKVIQNPGMTREYKVNDRDTSTVAETIKAGEPVGQSTNYVVALDDDAPIIDGSVAAGIKSMAGIARNTSNETASADGVVDVTIVNPMTTVMRGKATATNANTAAKLLLLLNDVVSFGLSATIYAGSGVYTIDEADSDQNVQGLMIIDGSADASNTVDVILKSRASDFGTSNA